MSHSPKAEFEENNGNNHRLPSSDAEETLKRIRTMGSVNISAELFEKLYLTPENKVKGELRKTFGNPTPMLVLIDVYI